MNENDKSFGVSLQNWVVFASPSPRTLVPGRSCSLRRFSCGSSRHLVISCWVIFFLCICPTIKTRVCVTSEHPWAMLSQSLAVLHRWQPSRFLRQTWCWWSVDCFPKSASEEIWYHFDSNTNFVPHVSTCAMCSKILRQCEMFHSKWD